MVFHRPLPIVDVETKPFWDACARERLIIQRCGTCATNRYPATTFCPNCRSAEAEWIECSGRGEVFSWIVVRTPIPRDMYEGQTPYTVALITLEEGVRLVSNIIDCAPEDVRGGMPVDVVFADIGADMKLPVFRPRDV